MFQQISVLVIEDEKPIRSLIRSMLKDIGIHQIFEAKDGSEGLKFLDDADDMVGFVVCDWNMPGVTGLELLRQLRMARPDIPFLMVTGRVDRDSVVTAKEAGVDAYIAKPFSRDQFEAKVRSLLQKKRRPAEVF
jgi:two-component system chemotaxis response regulator CheY